MHITIYIYIHTYIHTDTGLFEMIVGVLSTCHTQYISDSSICIFLFNRTTLQVFVTYLTGALYVHPLWTIVTDRHSWNVSTLPFVAILVNCAPSGEMRNYCTPHIVKENFENFLIHWCNCTLLSQVYCIWQVVKTPTIISNNTVCVCVCIYIYIYIYNIKLYYKRCYMSRCFCTIFRELRYCVW